jgi:MoaA/NifB/PqqE/SkfB family radical SAM enzyme
MFRSLREEFERFTRPLCSAAQYETKLANFQRVEESFAARSAYCTGLPVQIHVEPSGYCNLLCPICPRGIGMIQRTGFLSLETFRKVFEHLADQLASLVFSGFGEPLLNRDTCRMIALASRHSVATFMNTNGTLLSNLANAIIEARLTRLNISLDGVVPGSPHRYPAEHPFAAVPIAVETMRKRKDESGSRFPILIGQFIVDENTSADPDRLERWALQLGVEQVRFKRKHPTMPSEIPRVELLAKHGIDRPLHHPRLVSGERLGWSQSDCTHPWAACFLGCNGRIGTCSFDPHLSNVFGDARDPFERIWNGKRMREIRRAHAGRGPEFSAACLRCNRLPGYLEQNAVRTGSLEVP